ncbi:MAG: PIN domain-containing protein [Acidobacteria bacterium]|nr:PIN domain-containing protein [Acidobacteriota bacterium]
MVTVALDTNVLAYAEGVNDPEKKAVALALLDKLPPESTMIPVQSLGELFNVLVRKAGRTKTRAQQAVLTWGDAFPLIETSPDVVLMAMDLAADHRLGVWDSVILAAAADARCRLLLSEDLQDGFTWSGVTVTNPFSSPRHPLLAAMLRQ